MSEILTIIDKDGKLLAYLNNLESANVHEIINGEYTVKFIALIEPLKTEYLYDNNNLIVYDNDYFRVVEFEELHNVDGMLTVSVTAEHISYDLIQNTMEAFQENDRAAVYVMNKALEDTEFNFIGTDVQTTASIDLVESEEGAHDVNVKNIIHSIATLWEGELKFFQRDIELKQSLGINRGVDFRFGKNIKEIRRIVNFAEATVSYDVQVIQGSELEELGYFDLGDTIRVIDDALNIDHYFRIVELEKDIITGTNSRVILGQPIKDMSNDMFSIKRAAENANKKVSQVVDEHGNLIASKLSGTLQTAIETVEGSKNGGMTYVPGVGIVLHNQPTQEESTEAMLLTANGLLISNSRNIDGSWRWRTAATGESISADAITTGELTAITINGVTITGSSITSDDANSEIKLSEGKFSIKKKSSNQQFNMNYRTGLPDNILQAELEYYNEFKASNPNKPAENTISLNSNNSHMGLEFGNGAVSIGNDWVNISMYGGTFDWSKDHPDWPSNPDYNPPPTNAVGGKIVIDCATTVWDLLKDYPGFATAYSSSMDVAVGNVDFYGNVEVGGKFSVSGTKNCTIKTEKFGRLDFSAYETADILLGDIGECEVINGECVINLDEKLLSCVNTDIPYQVFLQAYGNGNVYVAERNTKSFIVKGDNIKFAWEVKAKRKEYENTRFGQPI